MKKEISLEKVAQRAGVAKSTVSFVLNNKNNVAPKTRDRVLAALQELGYAKPHTLHNFTHPVSADGSLKNILIYVNPHVRDDEVVGTYMSGLRKYASEDHQVSFTFAMSSTEVESSIQLQFLEQATQPQAILMMGINSDHPFMQQALQTGKPCLVLNRVNNHPGLSYVAINHREAGQDAARYLLALGHRHFAVIFERSYNESEVARIEGFLAELATKAGEVEVAVIRQFKATILSEDYRAGRLVDLLRDEKLLFNSKAEFEVPPDLKIVRHEDEMDAEFNPTCLVAAHDVFASAVQAGVQAAGLKVPGDVSVMSFNSSSFALNATPSITVIDELWHDQGYLAGQTLKNLIDNKFLSCQKILVRHRIVERGSTARPKRGS